MYPPVYESVVQFLPFSVWIMFLSTYIVYVIFITFLERQSYKNILKKILSTELNVLAIFYLVLYNSLLLFCTPEIMQLILLNTWRIVPYFKWIGWFSTHLSWYWWCWCCLEIYSCTLLSPLFHFAVTWTFNFLLNKPNSIRRHQTSTIF